MPLNKPYSPDFERLYRAWPNYPKGRTKKHLAAKAFDKVKKEFCFTADDIDEIIGIVEQMKVDRASWQPGNPYGPQGLQVWLNQAGWQDEYETIYENRGNYVKPNKLQLVTEQLIRGY